jgi:hypothetical protein
MEPVQIERGTELQRSSRRDGFGGKSVQTRERPPRTVLGMKKAATPWGQATLVEELKLPQQSGEKRFASLVQLLETESGERLVRFAYATDGVARRGPVTFRARDLERLRKALEKHPGLQETLRL